MTHEQACRELADTAEGLRDGWHSLASWFTAVEAILVERYGSALDRDPARQRATTPLLTASHTSTLPGTRLPAEGRSRGRASARAI